jgi:flavin-dependent dehydrogenase
MNIQLRDVSSIVVIGGGPSGSFFTHFALRLAKEHGRRIQITILDGRNFIQKGPGGCNMCAGVLSETLIRKMESQKIDIPKSRVQQEINGYYFQTQERGIQLHHPKPGHKPKIITVFRGNGPRFSELTTNISFDDFLQKHVASQGVKIVSAVVEEIELPKDPQDLVNIVYKEADVRKKMSVDLVVGAFGLNTALIKRIVGKEFGYREPKSVRTCNAELYLGRSFIQERFRNIIYVFALGIKPIKFAAFTPKGDYITVSLIGREDITKAHLIEFIRHPKVRELLPEGWTLPKDLCICFPKIPVTHAEHPYANRLVIIGDAGISRTYKNGIESAFDTAQLAGRTIFERGVSAEDFKNGYYKPALRLLAQDNFFGNLIFGIHDYTTSKRHLVNAQMDHLAKRHSAWESIQINNILWNVVTGNASYKDIFFKVIDVRLHIAMFPYTLSAALKQGYDYWKHCTLPERSKKVTYLQKSGLGPLRDGQTVAIIGGGPAGVSCAITLKNLAKNRNINLDVVVYEPKDFEGGIEHNECAGVLSQPIEHIIEDKLGIPFPWHLVKREVPGYYLHTDSSVIKLDGEGEISYALRRVQFDAYLLKKAIEAGATVIRSKVTDVEIGKDKVTVYSETKHIRADVVVGAFGLEEGTHRIFERETSYKSPKYLLTILTKFHPKGQHHDLEDTDGYIHAFLPSLKGIEFGAVTPKADHYTMNIAGAKISSRSMDEFLRIPAVLEVLPKNFKASLEKLDYHRGCFPIKPASHFVGDRYVTIGDAAGLIRPFKGKGVNSACLMGIKAAETMMDSGISREAFQTYADSFNEIIKDLPYAHAVRRFVIWGAYYGFMTPIIQIAKDCPALKKTLFDSVSGKKAYRKILIDTMSITLFIRVAITLMRWLIKRIVTFHGRHFLV